MSNLLMHSNIYDQQKTILIIKIMQNFYMEHDNLIEVTLN